LATSHWRAARQWLVAKIVPEPQLAPGQAGAAIPPQVVLQIPAVGAIPGATSDPP